jgi:hypothetical protein
VPAAGVYDHYLRNVHHTDGRELSLGGVYYRVEMPEVRYQADSVGEHHGVTHAQLGNRPGGTDRVKQLPARVVGVGDRDQMLIKLSRRDRVEQLTLGILQSAFLRLEVTASIACCRRSRCLRRYFRCRSGCLSRVGSGHPEETIWAILAQIVPPSVAGVGPDCYLCGLGLILSQNAQL